MESQRKKEKIVSLKVFALEAFLFCLALVLGIATAFRINETLKVEEIILTPLSFWQFVSYFIFINLFILLISYFLRFRKEKVLIFRFIFLLAVFSGAILLLSVWVSGIVALILISGLIFWWLKKPSVFIQDLLIVLAISGAGSIIGLQFTPGLVTLLLIVFSVYDFLSVYKTKHMIKMAKEMIESKAILALVVPPDVLGFKEDLRNIKPGGKFLILGGGDIVFPLVLASSLVPFGIFKSLIVAFFSLLGLFLSFLLFVSQKTRRPIPALPPIALFAISGYCITLIF